MSRKKSKDPKNKNIHLRITENEEKEIKELCCKYCISSIADFTRKAIFLYKEWLKKK